MQARVCVCVCACMSVCRSCGGGCEREGAWESLRSALCPESEPRTGWEGQLLPLPSLPRLFSPVGTITGIQKAGAGLGEQRARGQGGEAERPPHRSRGKAVGLELGYSSPDSCGS